MVNFRVANVQATLMAVVSGTLRLKCGRSRSLDARSGTPHALE